MGRKRGQVLMNLMIRHALLLNIKSSYQWRSIRDSGFGEIPVGVPPICSRHSRHYAGCSRNEQNTLRNPILGKGDRTCQKFLYLYFQN